MKSRMSHLILAPTLGLFFVLPLILLVVQPVWAQPERHIGAQSLVTKTVDDGTIGTLRQAIAFAVDGDTILFDSSLNGQTITLTSGELVITKNLTINGPGANLLVISGNNASRVFDVTSTVTISGVTIKEGVSESGGGILNFGGSVTLINSTVSGNSAAIAGGGVFNRGSGSVTLTNSTVSGNSANFAGGVINDAGSVTLTNSTVSGNSANDGGGGIYNNIGSVTLTNSTISGNSVTEEFDTGGGIFNDAGSVSLTNSTVSGNSATDGGGIYNNIGSVTLANSIVAKNPSSSDCFGPITSQGYNLDSDNTCNLTAPGDITNTDPKLEPLQDNGGATLTQALLNGNPAIDKIPNGTNGCGTTITSDQRGIVRPQEAGCDIGAYELEASNFLYLPIIFNN